MPNHVRTVIKFKNLKKEDDFEFIIRMIARPLTERDDMFTPDHEDWMINFNKIIPEPKTKEECPTEFILPEKGGTVERSEDRPWFNWYTWRLANWDTKWGAYDGYTERGKTYLTFVFSTAWSLARPIIYKLRILEYDFEVLYADEDLGSNCGKLIYTRNDNCFEEVTPSDMKNPREFAKRLWDKY